jgi:hypothetical protein
LRSCSRLGKRVGTLGEGTLRNRCRRGGTRGVKVLYKGAAEVNNRPCRIYRDARELRNVLAAVSVGSEM